MSFVHHVGSVDISGVHDLCSTTDLGRNSLGFIPSCWTAREQASNFASQGLMADLKTAGVVKIKIEMNP